MFSLVQCPHGSHGAAQGCMSVGASYSQGWLPGIPEEWGGGCHTRPNLFSQTLSLQNTLGMEAAWGMWQVLKRGNKNADLRPLAVLQVPHTAQKLGKPGFGEVKPLAQGHPDHQAPSSVLSPGALGLPLRNIAPWLGI